VCAHQCPTCIHKPRSGSISTEEFRDTLLKLQLGHELSKADIEEIIREIDTDEDKEINLHEFKALIKMNQQMVEGR
jgi:Ca2+-binding EF-hand superfamily protein